MNPTTDWYNNFFTGPVLDTVRSMMPPALTQAECDFASGELGLAKGCRILDVPCGAGRHAVELAKRGCRVTGIDLSPELIADARIASEGLDAEFLVADMRELPSGPFDAACCLGNSFAYMDDAGNTAFLAAVRRALRPGARFLLQTSLCAESVLPNLKPRSWYEFAGTLMLHETRYEPAEGRLISEYGFLIDGRIDRRAAGYRIYLFRELVQMLASAGFRIKKASGSPAGDDFKLGSPGLYAVCEAV